LRSRVNLAAGGDIDMFRKIIVVIAALFGIGLLFSFISLAPDAKATTAHVSEHADPAKVTFRDF
jgi:hypothetical protein